MSIEKFRETFGVDQGYLNWAAFGPLSTSVVSDVQVDAELLALGRKSGIELVTDHATEALDLLSQALDVPVRYMNHQASTTHALQQAIYGIKSGRVMASLAEWPSVTIPIARAADAYGQISPQWITPTDGFVTPEVVADALTPETTALVVSLVDFRTGYRADLGGLRDVLGDDRLLIVDAVQGFGVIDVDFAAADVVAGNGYKWLRAGRGAGWASFSDQARERLRPTLSNVAGLGDGPMFDTIGRPADSAQAFQTSAPEHLACARMVAAMGDVLAVGIDVIEGEIARRTAEIIEIADRFDIDVATPRGASQRAGIVSLVPRHDGAAMLSASLANNDVTVTTRGDAVRVAPHAGTDDATMRMFEDSVAAFAQMAR